MKCLNCGKDNPPSLSARQRKFCCKDCQQDYFNKKAKIKRFINRIAKEYSLEVKNVDKIVRAKLMLFKDGNLHGCPCSADDVEKYCGSPKCLNEINKKGNCCCNLFFKC